MGKSPKIFSKTIKVGDRAIKANFTKEMLEDLKAMSGIEGTMLEIERQRKRADRLAKLNHLNKLSEEQQ